MGCSNPSSLLGSRRQMNKSTMDTVAALNFAMMLACNLDGDLTSSSNLWRLTWTYYLDAINLLTYESFSPSVSCLGGRQVDQGLEIKHLFYKLRASN
eukprot:844163-Ditylum_brightwellii.AAC.1